MKIMYNRILITAALGSAIIMTQCSKTNTNDPIPKITFIELEKSEMVQNSLNIDSINILISFEDGDGDLGGQNSENIIVIDNRSGEIYDTFSFPDLPQSKDGVNGEVYIRLFTTCCIFPDRIPPCSSPEQFPTNNFTLDIYVIDEAGNQSNTITTSPITLLCR